MHPGGEGGVGKQTAWESERVLNGGEMEGKEAITSSPPRLHCNDDDAHQTLAPPEAAAQGGGVLPEGEGSNGGVVAAAEEEPSTAMESDHMACSICMEPWTGEGLHRVCSLACGHLFGRSCIKRWLKQDASEFRKCPHCNRKAKIADIRNLYVPRIVIADGHNTNVSEELCRLKAKNKELSTQNAMLLAELHRMQAFFSILCPQQIETITNAHDRRFSFDTSSRKRVNPSLNQCSEKHRKEMEGPHQNFMTTYRRMNSSMNTDCKASTSTQLSLISHLHHEAAMPFTLDCHVETEMHIGCKSPAGIRPLDESVGYRNNIGSTTYTRQQFNMIPNTLVQQCHGIGIETSFQLHDELSLQGAKVFDMDGSSQMLLVSHKLSYLKDAHKLTKMSLLALSEWESIHLPPNTGVVRDIRIAPAGVRFPGRLTLIASLGKKLSILSLESNNIVLTYNLQSPAWSCAWDPSEPDYFYAGLQNGFLSVFDLRQTALPLNTIQGLNSNPIHSLYVAHEYLPNGSAVSTKLDGKEVLSASSAGICIWNVGTSNGNEYRPSFLPHVENQGVCVSLAYSASTNIAIATFRPRPGSQVFLSGSHSLTQGMNSTCLEATSGHGMSITSQLSPAAHFIVKRKTAVNKSKVNDQAMWLWEQEKFMTGCISNIGTPRSVIIHESKPGFGELFASGDERSKRLCLWDINSLTLSHQLSSNCSSILDVRSINGSSGTIIGCMSEKQLQIYSSLCS